MKTIRFRAFKILCLILAIVAMSFPANIAFATAENGYVDWNKDAEIAWGCFEAFLDIEAMLTQGDGYVLVEHIGCCYGTFEGIAPLFTPPPSRCCNRPQHPMSRIVLPANNCLYSEFFVYMCSLCGQRCHLRHIRDFIRHRGPWTIMLNPHYRRCGECGVIERFIWNIR